MQQQGQYDENLYSRQVAVYGAETQAKLVQMKCFIHGLRGLGVEVAKNLILAGPNSVILYDPELVTLSDLGANFYTKQEQVGKVSRAEASVEQLKELNPYVTVEIWKGEPTPDALSAFNVVILTDVWDQKYITAVNEAVRAKNNGFIYGHSSGLFGSVFVDYSNKFQVFDVNGEEPKSTIIAGITKEVDSSVHIHDEKRHGFQDGDYVTFREVLGMTEVNDKVFPIKVKSPYIFTIGDTSNFSNYLREGIAVQVKMPQTIQFKSFLSSLTHPIAPERTELDLVDWEKIGRPELLHIAINALFVFAEQNGGKLPELLNKAHADKVWEIAQAINASDRGADAVKTELSEEVVKNCALYARAQVTPTASFWGGVIAQEIMKFTGKFSPIRQWLHCEFFEALPEGEQDRTPQNKQYDDYIALFGRATVAKIQNSRTFMVGAGALGCEYVKMFSLMGQGSGPQGTVVITDDDNIEISNLNRQFLFRKHNVTHNKAKTASEVGKRMNPDVNFDPKALRVGKDNEEVFHDVFWEGLDIVVNAVDNIHARRYIDEQCCYYAKPLFESGTLGTKCNSQLILPFKTQSYSESQDPPEESIPLCTLKNFPYQIEHTIQWARDYFEGVFADGSAQCVKYLENPTEYIQKTMRELSGQPGVLRPRLETIKKYVEVSSNPTQQKCVELARNMFQDVFFNQIHQLLHCFPLDHKTEEGQLFWISPKRPPTPIDFNLDDPTHLQFVQSAANIFAYIFNLPYEKDINRVKELITKCKVEAFQPKNVTLKANDKDTKVEKSEDDEVVIAQITAELSALKLTNDKPKLQVVEFEKDDPTNWHIELLSSVANLRGRNYKIQEVPPFQVKLIAGKIIPALATTTAMIVGAVGLEIFKYFQNKDVAKMRNAFINLALPLFLFSEPLPPGQHEDQANSQIYLGPTKAIPPKWTAWDKITIQGGLTIKQFLEKFKTDYDVEVTSITVGKYVLFTSYPVPTQQTLNSVLEQLYQTKFDVKLPNYKVFLDLTVGGDIMVNGVDTNADLAPVKYRFQI